MRTRGGKPPSTTPSSWGDINQTATGMGEGCKRSDLPNMKELCLERENYRCAVTGCYAAKYAEGKFDIPNEHIQAESLRVVISHIIPFALGSWKNTEEVSISSYYPFTLSNIIP